MKYRALVQLLLALWILSVALPAPGQSQPPFKDVGIDQKLNAQVPLDLVFRDETGQSVALEHLLRGRPVLLIPVQFNCPSLCTVILNDSLSTLKVIPQNAGTDYDIWTVSFDPTETPPLAAAKRESYLRAYQHTRPDAVAAPAGWHFLTGTQENITALTAAVGYRYHWDPVNRQFVHPAGLILLTPEGKVSRYFFGVDYDPTDVRLSLVEAAHGKIGSFTDKLLLFCYHYDPASGRYTLAITNVLRLAAIATVLLLAGGVVLLWRADRRRTRRLAALSSGPSASSLSDPGGAAP